MSKKNLTLPSGSPPDSQNANLQINVQSVPLVYRGKTVRGRELTVSSTLPMPADQVWAKVQTPALLQFVARGMIRFKPLDGGFPPTWKPGETYRVWMRIFGFIPFGGTHYLQVEKIDPEQYFIATREWDQAAKVWNQHIQLQTLPDGQPHYQDRIYIYGGLLTGVITAFAHRFYRH